MSSYNNEGMQFAIDVLQKALVSKDDEITKMKNSNQIQLYVLLNEISKRDEQNDQLKERNQSFESAIQSNTQQMTQYKDQIEKLKSEVRMYRTKEIELAKKKDARSKPEREKKDISILNHIQQTYGCHAAWDLADRCFQVKKGYNLPSILGSFQSKHYIDLGNWRLIKCVQCTRFRTTQNNSSACLAMKFKASNRAGFGIYLSYPINDFDSNQLSC